MLGGSDENGRHEGVQKNAAMKLWSSVILAAVFLAAAPVHAQGILDYGSGKRTYRSEYDFKELDAPRDFEIVSDRGERIRVHYEQTYVGAVPDKAYVCFATSGALPGWKTFVFENWETFELNAADPGPKCVERFLQFDYESFDDARQRRKNQGQRDNAFHRRVITPMHSYRQVAFYRDRGRVDANRLAVRNVWPMDRVYTGVERADEVLLELWPGYRTTLLWITD